MLGFAADWPGNVTHKTGGIALFFAGAILTGNTTTATERKELPEHYTSVEAGGAIMASEWLYKVTGKEVGPVSPAELWNLAQRGIISSDTLVNKSPVALGFSAEPRARVVYGIHDRTPATSKRSPPGYRREALTLGMRHQDYHLRRGSRWAWLAACFF